MIAKYVLIQKGENHDFHHFSGLLGHAFVALGFEGNRICYGLHETICALHKGDKLPFNTRYYTELIKIIGLLLLEPHTDKEI